MIIRLGWKHTKCFMRNNIQMQYISCRHNYFIINFSIIINLIELQFNRSNINNKFYINDTKVIN